MQAVIADIRHTHRAEGLDRDRLLQTFLDLVAIDSPTGGEEEIGKDLEVRFGELLAERE